MATQLASTNTPSSAMGNSLSSVAARKDAIAYSRFLLCPHGQFRHTHILYGRTTNLFLVWLHKPWKGVRLKVPEDFAGRMG